MDAGQMVQGILVLYIVLLGIALSAYFISLCKQEWEDMQKKKEKIVEQKVKVCCSP